MHGMVSVPSEGTMTAGVCAVVDQISVVMAGPTGYTGALSTFQGPSGGEAGRLGQVRRHDVGAVKLLVGYDISFGGKVHGLVA